MSDRFIILKNIGQSQLFIFHRIAEIFSGDRHSAAVKAYIVGFFGEFLYLIEVATTGKNTYVT